MQPPTMRSPRQDRTDRVYRLLGVKMFCLFCLGLLTTCQSKAVEPQVAIAKSPELAKSQHICYEALRRRAHIKLSFEYYQDKNFSRRFAQFSIVIRESWSNGLAYDWINGSGESFRIVLPDLDSCRYASIQSFVGQDFYPDECNFWLSPRHYSEIKAYGRSLIVFERERRGGERFDFVEKLDYSLYDEEEPIRVPALKLRSEVGTEIILYDNPDEPLILSLEGSHFGWKILRVSREKT